MIWKKIARRRSRGAKGLLNKTRALHCYCPCPFYLIDLPHFEKSSSISNTEFIFVRTKPHTACRSLQKTKNNTNSFIAAFKSQHHITYERFCNCMSQQQTLHTWIYTCALGKQNKKTTCLYVNNIKQIEPYTLFPHDGVAAAHTWVSFDGAHTLIHTHTYTQHKDIL